MPLENLIIDDLCEFFQNKQARILRKRAQQGKGYENSSGLFGNYSDYI